MTEDTGALPDSWERLRTRVAAAARQLNLLWIDTYRDHNYNQLDNWGPIAGPDGFTTPCGTTPYQLADAWIETAQLLHPLPVDEYNDVDRDLWLTLVELLQHPDAYGSPRHLAQARAWLERVPPLDAEILDHQFVLWLLPLDGDTTQCDFWVQIPLEQDVPDSWPITGVAGNRIRVRKVTRTELSAALAAQHNPVPA